MPLILPGNVASALPTGYEVANSCRFNRADSAYMHKTPGSAGNQIQFTISLWCKRGTLGTKQTLFSAVNDANNETECHFETDDTLNFRDNEGGSWMIQKRTAQVFRDCSAWYHLVFSSVSGTQKIWVNGVEVTSWTTNTNGSGTATWNDDNVMTVGAKFDGSSASDYFDGYIAEFVSIDGSTLTPTSFGEFNEDSPNIWQPIDVSALTFGTNGFYLDFEASDNLGNDANGGTDLTEVNLAAEDQASDSPTNNFCTLDPNASSPTITFSQGNCRHQNNSGNDQGSVGTFAVSTGKWYWEVKCVDRPEVGILTDTDRNVLPDNTVSPNAMLEVAGIVNSFGNGNDMRFNGATIDTNLTTSLADNDILSVAVDVDNEKIWFGKNGTWMNSGDPAAGSNEIKDFSDADTRFVTPFHNITTGNTDILEYNFGGCSAFTVSSANNDGDGYGNFEYSVPSGFYSLCTKNLAEYG